MTDDVTLTSSQVHRTEGWESIPWQEVERNVFRLQKRIYQAVRRGDFRQAHNLQRLLLRSWSARCLAVRRVTQDNRGKRTAGVDGIANVSPLRRMQMVEMLRNLKQMPDLVRRVYIPKTSGAWRPLGIPVMMDRALQALVKLALEPEWDAQFEAGSYGFRPGRGCHDAIRAIVTNICQMPKYVLDADIEKCFDRIHHDALLQKMRTFNVVRQLVEGWLKAGIVERNRVLYPTAGTPQGGVISPLLANIALHGFETTMREGIRSRWPIKVIRYADDFVMIHPELAVIEALQARADTWLQAMGLRLNMSKTRITHTLYRHGEHVGFDFLGFTIRQFAIGKHQCRTYTGRPGIKTVVRPSKDGIKRHRRELKNRVKARQNLSQAGIIGSLNPVIRGWANYYRTCQAGRTFASLDYYLDYRLVKWAQQKHQRRNPPWLRQRYWRRIRNRSRFSTGKTHLHLYAKTANRLHIKVRGTKSPFDGDWLYWANRLGRDPTKPQRVAKLLREQSGKCHYCGLPFCDNSVMEVHHLDGNHLNHAQRNMALLHGHCHDRVHAESPLAGYPRQGPLS